MMARIGLAAVRIARVAAAVAGLSTAPQPGTAQTASPARSALNCAKATARVERMICDDPGLLRQDGYLGFAYTGLIRAAPAAERRAIVRDEHGWLARRNACTDRVCISNSYDLRTAAVWKHRERIDRWRRRGVARVGQCQATTITEIGSRLAGVTRPDDSGTTVSFANGVHQVSYELERAIARSRIGDPARVCLVAIPQHCPPGDDRGRAYAVTNLRSGERWRLFDSQHLCGGA